MSNLRYFHIREEHVNGELKATGGVTVVTDSNITQQAIVGDSITLNIGIAFCHSDDNYNKKTGRAVANGRAKITEFAVKNTSVVSSMETRYLELESESHVIIIKLVKDKLFVVKACRR